MMRESADLPGGHGQAFESKAERTQAELMERLDQKVEAVFDLRQRIETIDSAATPEEAHRALDQSWASIREMFPAETILRFDRLTAIHNRLRELNVGYFQAFDDFSRDLDHPEMKKMQAEMNSLRQEELPLLEDEDLQFLMNVENVMLSLKKKNNDISGLRDQPFKIMEELNTYFKEDDIKPSDVLAIDQTPFEISVTLKPKSYKRVYGQNEDSLGMHFENSPFSVIRQGPDDNKTKQHESVHNILDGATDIRDFHNSQMQTLAEQHRSAPDNSVRLEIEEKLLRYRPTSLVNQMHNEFLAELNHWEQQPWNHIRPKVLFHDPNRPKPFAFHARNYSSAGSDAQEIFGIFGKLAKQTNNREFKEAIKNNQQEFSDKFTQAVEHMRQALFTARAHGDQAVERLHGLMFVLPPSRYRHLERYLEYTYGTNTE